MNKTTLSLTLLLTLFFLAACGGNATQTPAETAVPTATVPQPTALPATETATESVPATAVPATEEVVVASSVSYSANIVPIFEAKCIKCHGVETTKEGLDMLTYDNMMTGSFNGPVVVAGDAANSLLVQLVERGKMPNRGAKVTPEELQVIIDWINQGALNN